MITGSSAFADDDAEGVARLVVDRTLSNPIHL